VRGISEHQHAIVTSRFADQLASSDSAKAALESETKDNQELKTSLTEARSDLTATRSIPIAKFSYPASRSSKEDVERRLELLVAEKESDGLQTQAVLSAAATAQAELDSRLHASEEEKVPHRTVRR
jgi:hypothetical protein